MEEWTELPERDGSGLVSGTGLSVGLTLEAALVRAAVVERLSLTLVGVELGGSGVGAPDLLTPVLWVDGVCACAGLVGTISHGVDVRVRLGSLRTCVGDGRRWGRSLCGGRHF